MKGDKKDLSSRRDFIRQAAVSAGAMTAVHALASEDQATRPGELPCTYAAAKDSGWRQVSSELTSEFKQLHQTVDLNGIWSVTPLPLQVQDEAGYVIFSRTHEGGWAAQVPGEIHLDLMRAGRMDDPNVSDNARARCRWPEQHSWWYRTEFQVTPEFRQFLRQRLTFEGIDLYGQVFLNGKLTGTAKDAFASFAFDVTDFLQTGTNELVVRVTSGLELTSATSESRPTDAKDTYAVRHGRPERCALRKPEYSAYGKDFCDPLPNIGISRSVRLEGRTKAVIDHLRLDTAIQGDEVALEGEVIIENLSRRSEVPCILELQVDPPRGRRFAQRLEFGAQTGIFAVRCRLVIHDPELWWPNGMGAQPLYRYGGMVSPLGNGFAVASTDDGHTGPGAAWAFGHPEKVIDYGYRAVHLTSVISKQVVATYYHRTASRTYFSGCSDGGRESLMEVQRYPDDFDGYLVGGPGNDFTGVMTYLLNLAQIAASMDQPLTNTQSKFRVET
jgi:hypothetical protein